MPSHLDRCVIENPNWKTLGPPISFGVEWPKPLPGKVSFNLSVKTHFPIPAIGDRKYRLIIPEYLGELNGKKFSLDSRRKSVFSRPAVTFKNIWVLGRMVGWEEEDHVTAGRPFNMLRTGYGVGFNRQHKRNGHLLQNRYKSIGCQEETYLQELVRYIHLNPLRAGVVPDLIALNSYPYCGHSALMGKRKRPWQNVDYVLHSFGKRVGRARGEYYLYVEAGVEQGRRRDLAGGGFAQGG